MDATIAFSTKIQDIARRRGILKRLVSSALKVKYEGSTLGYVWSVLEPLLLTGAYFLVFGVLGRFKTHDYGLFLIAGILPWQWVTQTVHGGTTALTGNASLITKVYLPREIFPLAVVLSKGVEFGLSLFVMVIFAVLYRATPSYFLVFFPFAVLLQLMLLTGVALLLSAANTLLRDVSRVVTPMLRVGFYLSPILYPLHTVFSAPLPHWFKVLYRANPMVGILELYHAVWDPDSFAGWTNVGIATAGAVLMFAAGWTLFARLERAVLKEL